MIKRFRIPVLAAGHGINDLLAGYFLGCIALQQQDALQIGLALFVYNLLAFGGQYPVALWIEKHNNSKSFLLASYTLNVFSAVIFLFMPSAAVVLAGAASAIYHVAGGSVCAADKKASGIGYFAAPGVAGLIAGGYFAWSGYHITWILLLTAVCFLAILFLLNIPDREIQEERNASTPSLVPDRHDIIMILLLVIISLRSAVWNIFQVIHENNYTWLIAIAAAACIGKILGGRIADRIGWRLYIFISLSAATPLLTFFKNEMILFCIGIGLLQSGIPATTAMLIEAAKGKTERGIGLAFGTAIIAGGISFMLPADFFNRSPFIPAGVIALVVLLFLLVVRKKPAVSNAGL